MLQLVVLTVLCLFLQCRSHVSDIVFPDEAENKQDDSKKEIPIELVLRLNAITDPEHLMKEFMYDNSATPVGMVGIEPDFIADRASVLGISPGGVERKGAIVPKPAGCMPEMRSVSLHDKKNDWEFYFPSCTRIEQCGGCCSHKLLSCQPTDTETINYQVIVSQYLNGKLSYKGKEIVTVEKHNKCKCDCIVKEQDCNQLQEYRKGECRCVCTNKDAEQKCLQDDKKLWNPDSCLCECRRTTECSTGSFFSQTSCSCDDIPRSAQTDLYRTRSQPARRKWPTRYNV